MFKLRRARREVELAESDFNPEMLVVQSLLDRSTQKVNETLTRFRAGEAELEYQIEALTEELRQTRVAIAAFDAAGAILDGSKPPAAIAADPGKVGRLVPRGRTSRSEAEAAILVDGDGRVLKSNHAEPPIVHHHKDIRA